MPRYARQTVPHSIQHVISRFINREYLLDAPDARDEYLRRAAAVAERTDWQPIAYALMSSHVHWVLVAGKRASSSFVKPLHSGFATWLNRAQGRLGPVFADRHRIVTFKGQTIAPLLAYVHNNPVRAGMVGDPLDSTWTSHRVYAGLAPSQRWLDVERGLSLAGFSPTRRGRHEFHQLVLSQCGEPRAAFMSGGDMQRHRALVRLNARAPLEIGTPTVTMRAGRRSTVIPTIVPEGCLARRREPCTELDVISAVARSIDMPVSAIRSRSRVRGTVHARQLALLIWVRHLDRPALTMARMLGIAASTASQLLTRAPHQAQQTAFEIASESVSI